MHTGTSKYLSAKVPDGMSNLDNVEYCMKGMYDNENILYQMQAFVRGDQGTRDEAAR